MSENETLENEAVSSFYDRPNVKKETIPVGQGIPFGIERVSNPALNIGGVYGSWGFSYDNQTLPEFVKSRMGEPLPEEERMNLGELGFHYRQHVPLMSHEDSVELELEVGTRMLREAAASNGWDPAEVDGVLIGATGPIVEDYVSQISHRAGIPGSAMKVSVHKACDGSTGALHLALNPSISAPGQVNIAEELRGKKVLVGGIEGLSRFLGRSHDRHALQLFGNGAGVIGIIPGVTMKFLAGKTFETYDEEGLLEVRMSYPHSTDGNMIDVSQLAPNHLRFAGVMHEPEDGSPIVMAGLMGMVKLFVRNGVQTVTDVYREYQALMEKLGQSGKSFTVGIVHHANYKINLLKAKNLLKEGVQFPMPWLLSDFGNVSAASNMIAFLRKLKDLKPGDHILFDGFGAGTYYDVVAIAL
jgi:3-oxoacyl-[acyl-carrier-protein] synthase III